MTVKIEANRVSEQEKIQLNSYLQSQQEDFCKAKASMTLVRFPRRSPIINHGHLRTLAGDLDENLAGPPGSDSMISRVHFLFKPVIPAAPEDFETTILLQFYSKPSHNPGPL